MSTVNKTVCNPTGSRTQTATASRAVPVLDGGRLTRIRQSIATDPTAYRAMVAGLERWVSSPTRPYGPINMLPALALVISLEGADIPARWTAYYRAIFQESMDTIDFRDRNTFREHGADLAYAYLWVAEYAPTVWSSTQHAAFRARFNEFHLYWADFYDQHRAYLVQDSDEAVMVLENMELAMRMAAEPLRSRATTIRNELKQALEAQYFAPNGIIGGGFWPESTSYNANTPRFYMRWRQAAAQTDAPPSEPNWPCQLAMATLFQWMADLSGVWVFNDPLNLDITAGSPQIYPASEFRMARMTANALLDTEGTPQHRALQWILDQTADPARQAPLYDGYMRILSEDLTVSRAADPATLELPYGYLTGDQGAFFARSDWSRNAHQFFSLNMRRGMVDHVGPQALSYEIFHGSKPISIYGAGQGGFADAITPVNTLYIENIDPGTGGFYPGVQAPTLRPKGPGRNLGAYADARYTAVTWEGKDLYNVTGWAQTADYARQVTRSILHFWDGVTLVHDRVVTDLSQDADLRKRYGSAFQSRPRRVMKLTRFQALPSVANSVYSATSQGKTHHYRSLLPVNATEIVDEVNAPRWAALDKNMFYPSHRAAHIEEFIDATDAEFASMQTWGNQGSVAPPAAVPVTVSGADVRGWAFRTAGQPWRIALFNRNPEVPVTTASLTVRLPADIAPGQPVDLYAVGWDPARSFALAVGTDRSLTLAPGQGASPNSGRVLRFEIR
jgi:hypothetical protein